MQFAPWAARLNASVTFIEYDLTLLMSMSALVCARAQRTNLMGQENLRIAIGAVELLREHEGEQVRLDPGGGPRSIPMTPGAEAAHDRTAH